MRNCLLNPNIVNNFAYDFIIVPFQAICYKRWQYLFLSYKRRNCCFLTMKMNSLSLSRYKATQTKCVEFERLMSVDKIYLWINFRPPIKNLHFEWYVITLHFVYRFRYLLTAHNKMHVHNQATTKKYYVPDLLDASSKRPISSDCIFIYKMCTSVL